MAVKEKGEWYGRHACPSEGFDTAYLLMFVHKIKGGEEEGAGEDWGLGAAPAGPRE